jgi:putative component of membrane protein insertase Oxa1/YidC/SpoIIIJ protein YidD
MKHLLLVTIKVYWARWPKHRKRECIYREKCSQYVYRITSQQGFLAGVQALWHRIRTCRPRFTVSSDPAGIGLVLVDGSFLPADLVAENIVAPILDSMRDLQRRYEEADRKMDCVSGY